MNIHIKSICKKKIITKNNGKLSILTPNPSQSVTDMRKQELQHFQSDRPFRVEVSALGSHSVVPEVEEDSTVEITVYIIQPIDKINQLLMIFLLLSFYNPQSQCFNFYPQ